MATTGRIRGGGREVYTAPSRKDKVTLSQFFFFVLRLYSSRCLIRLTLYNGPPFLSVADVPGSTFSQRCVLPGLPLPADKSRPLHHQPSAYLHTICIVPAFPVSVPPQSASSHHISNCLYSSRGVFSVQCWTVFLSGKHQTSS